MWSLSGRPTSGTGRGNSKSARGQITAEDTCLSCVRRLEIVYILCDSPRVSHGSLPSCTLWEGSKRRTTAAPPGEARKGRTSPKSALCGPVWRTSLRLGPGETLGCEAPSFPDGKAPGFSACAGLWAAFPPQVGERPVLAHPGAIWAPQGPVWQKEKDPPLPVWGEFGGVILKQDKGSGSPERPQPDHLPRQSRSLRAFCPLPPPKKSGVGWEALGLRSGSETQNFPAASHFSGCHRRGQRKDEEKIWQIKI